MSQSLSDVLSVPDYQAARAHIFPSRSALDWFIRTHRGEMVQAGALLLLQGQWRVNPGPADRVIAEIGKRQAEERLARMAA